MGNIWWETRIKHLFAIGEVNGSHGVHRPGGAALNSGQVGGLRAAQRIGRAYSISPPVDGDQFKNIVESEMKDIVNSMNAVVFKKPLMNVEQLTPTQFWAKIQNRMSKLGGILRPLKNLIEEGKNIIHEIYNLKIVLILENNKEIIDYLRIKDALLAQQFFLESILNYHEFKGKSRGSYLILRENLDESYNKEFLTTPSELSKFKFIKSDRNLKKKIQAVQTQMGMVSLSWEAVRKIPSDFGWFENVWKDFTDGKIFE